MIAEFFNETSVSKTVVSFSFSFEKTTQELRNNYKLMYRFLVKFVRPGRVEIGDGSVDVDIAQVQDFVGRREIRDLIEPHVRRQMVVIEDDRKAD